MGELLVEDVVRRLTPEQQARLRWLQQHHIVLRGSRVEGAPELRLAPGVLLEGWIDSHLLTSARDVTVGGAFDLIYPELERFIRSVE